MTVDIVDSDYRIEQGPDWLVDLFVNPDWWMFPALLLIGGVVVALSLLSLHRNGLTPAIAEEIVELGLIGFGVIFVTEMVVSTGWFSYVADVAIGGVGGFVVGSFVASWITPIVRKEVDEMGSEDTVRSASE